MARSNGFDDASELAATLRPVMKAIALTIGPRCEVVLHRISPGDELGSSIVAIENGHVTGRSVGGPTTNLGLEALATGNPDPDRFNYRTRTNDGRQLRSSSVYFRGPDETLIGALCLNLDVSPYLNAHAALAELIGPLPSEDGDEVPETFGREIGEVLDALIRQSVDRSGVALGLMTREQKVEVIRDLDERGAFLVKRAIDRIARALQISRVTAYAYLQEARARSLAQRGSP